MLDARDSEIELLQAAVSRDAAASTRARCSS